MSRLIVDFKHNQVQKFASIAGGVEDRKKLGGYPKLGGGRNQAGGVESRYKLYED